MIRSTVLVCFLALLPAAAFEKADVQAEFLALQNESNLEKRADRSWKYAEARLKDARKHYKQGEWNEMKTSLADMMKAAELGYQSLEDTGKDPRRRSKHFKRGEIQTRNLFGHLNDFITTMGYDEQTEIMPMRNRLRDIHEELLLGVMGVKSR
jgi:hypothetical protein